MSIADTFLSIEPHTNAVHGALGVHWCLVGSSRRIRISTKLIVVVVASAARSANVLHNLENNTD